MLRQLEVAGLSETFKIDCRWLKIVWDGGSSLEMGWKMGGKWWEMQDEGEEEKEKSLETMKADPLG